MLAQLDGKDLDFEFFDCVVGKDLSDDEIAQRCDVARIHELNKNVEWFNRGIIGCSLTSQAIHQAIVEQDLETAMLLEDDTLLPPNLNSILEQCKSVLIPGDIVLLFWLSWKTVRLKHESRVELPSITLYETEDLGWVTGGSATIFTKTAAANMLQFNTPIQLTPDCWGDFASAGCFNRVLLAYPSVIDTADLMSTMEQGRFLGVRKFVDRYRIFPFYQVLRSRRRLSKRTRRSAVVI